MKEYKPYSNQAIEKSIVEIREKIFNTSMLKDYNVHEQALIKTAYFLQGEAYGKRGRILGSSCSSCFKDAIKLIRNHINLYDCRYIEPTIKPICKTAKDIEELKTTPLEHFKPKTVKEYKDALKHEGIKIPRGATKAELRKLWQNVN